MLNSLCDLRGRVALVTGASQGIGAAVATLLAEMGADVALNHRADAANADAVVERLRGLGRRAHAFDVDIGRRNVVEALVRPVEQALGPVDILVANAALTLYRRAEELAEDDIDVQVETNFKSTLRLMNALVPPMAQRRFGRVVAVGSINQQAPIPILPVYGALKAAQYALMLGQARRWSAYGVTFNSVSPGLIRTARNDWRRAPGGDWDSLSRECSYAGRAGQPEEVAWAIAMLCAPGGAYITGENIHVAGGAQVPGPRDLGPAALPPSFLDDPSETPS